MTASVVKQRFLFAGRAAAGSAFAKIACLKTCGECPAMRLPGRVRIVEVKMVLATSKIGWPVSPLPAEGPRETGLAG